MTPFRFFSNTLLCIIIPVFFLISCSFPWSKEISQNSVQELSLKKKIVGGDKVMVSYHLIETGKAPDELTETLIVGSGSFPYIGLHESLIGMIEGEKRSVKLPPEKLYGNARQTKILRMSQVLPNTVETISLKDLSASGSQYSFSGQTPRLGLDGKKGNIDAKITKIKDGLVTLRVVNPFSPFHDSALKVGSEGDWNGGKIRIDKIEGEYVTVSYPTGHELSGKSLVLELEVKHIYE